jgi:hypothetical protein|tara:strand:+ start:55 stop:492 length:438 start_codon:yes stop_codon:yes gene_type:complete
MAGFSTIYCIGWEGGFQGSDGMNPIHFQILQGEGERRWLEPHYFDKTITPIGRISIVIPESPDLKDAIIDACVAFAPKFFEKCPTLEQVKKECSSITTLDFDLSKETIPDSWYVLRKEARPIVEKELNIVRARMNHLEPSKIDEI